MTLNNEMQQDVDVPVVINNVPDSVTVLTDIPPSVKVSLRDKGSVFMRNRVSGIRPIRIEWSEYADNTTDNTFRLSKVELAGLVRDNFAQSTQVLSVVPDSMRLNYTTAPGIVVPVTPDVDMAAAPGYIINGPIVLSTDSVTMYAIGGLSNRIKSVSTMPVSRSNLIDTTHINIRLKSIDGVKIVPPSITITVPVEPLIARKQMATVTAKNVPDGTGLLTFPSTVEVSYLVPMSDFNKEPFAIKAYVDYSDVAKSHSGKLPVTLSLLPENYRNVSTAPDSVEYIVERH
ncbi:MAG: hypothetical protein NC343_02225 [Muribaculum sp.]|nr:hypothetical protein [Muribaculum sp.]